MFQVLKRYRVQINNFHLATDTMFKTALVNTTLDFSVATNYRNVLIRKKKNIFSRSDHHNPINIDRQQCIESHFSSNDKPSGIEFHNCSADNYLPTERKDDDDGE